MRQLSLLNLQLNSTLRMEAPSGGTHGFYLWEKQVNGVWTSVNHLNESSQGNVFTISSMNAQDAGNYRYKVTNSWMPAFLIEGGAILMNLTDPVNSPSTYRINALYNGMITSTRWRTAKPYAATSDGLKGMCICMNMMINTSSSRHNGQYLIIH